MSSYRSNYANWEAGTKGNMFLETSDQNQIMLKLFVNRDWVWVAVNVLPTDVKYLKKYWSHVSPHAPVLEKRYGVYYLRFAFEEKVQLSDTPAASRRICAVDLGLNSDAVCSIIAPDGTVLARKFVNLPCEKDHLDHVLNRIKCFLREHGSKNVRSFWNYARRLNDELAKKIASSIVEFAVLYSADCIVFEHLDFRGKTLKGSKKQRLHMWKKNGIQNNVEHKAHRCNIRISHICAWNTSKLAYDGSGEVQRDENNRVLCTFASGKRYNCDLSASYNIGAGYFIREILKPFPETERSDIQAIVPGCQRRTSCTLDTLRTFAAVMPQACAA